MFFGMQPIFNLKTWNIAQLLRLVYSQYMQNVHNANNYTLLQWMLRKY